MPAPFGLIRYGVAPDHPRAEIDLLCALSTCPGGDLSVPLWGPGARDPVDVCHPIGVGVHRPDSTLLKDWTSPRTASYRNLHGLRAPERPW